MKSQKLPKYCRKTRNQNSFETLRPVDNESSALIEIKDCYPDTISFWIAAYFRFEVTTSKSSQKVQKRDLDLFRDFMISECGREDRPLWSPRLSKDFAERFKKKRSGQGKGRLLRPDHQPHLGLSITWILHESEAFICKAFKGKAIVYYAEPLITQQMKGSDSPVLLGRFILSHQIEDRSRKLNSGSKG